jgi:hypothetical protein
MKKSIVTEMMTIRNTTVAQVAALIEEHDKLQDRPSEYVRAIQIRVDLQDWIASFGRHSEQAAAEISTNYAVVSKAREIAYGDCDCWQMVDVIAQVFGSDFKKDFAPTEKVESMKKALEMQMRMREEAKAQKNEAEITIEGLRTQLILAERKIRQMKDIAASW